MTHLNSLDTIPSLPAAMRAVLDGTAALDGERPLERSDIEALVALAATPAGREPGFVDAFAAIVADYVLYQERPTACLSDDTAAWLIGLLSPVPGPATLAVRHSVQVDAQDGAPALNALAPVPCLAVAA